MSSKQVAILSLPRGKKCWTSSSAISKIWWRIVCSPNLNWLTKSERREVYCLFYTGKNAEKLGHLSIRLLWSHQLSFMFFQQAVLIVISQLYRSSIDQLLLDKLQKVWELRVKMWPTIQWHSSFFLMRICVPRVPNMINYIFSPYLQLSNGKWLFLQKKTVAFH